MREKRDCWGEVVAPLDGMLTAARVYKFFRPANKAASVPFPIVLSQESSQVWRVLRWCVIVSGNVLLGCCGHFSLRER
jgi:hypothetical protein